MVGGHNFQTSPAFNKAAANLGGHYEAQILVFNQTDIAELGARSTILKALKGEANLIPENGSISLDDFVAKVGLATKSLPSPNAPGVATKSSPLSKALLNLTDN